MWAWLDTNANAVMAISAVIAVVASVIGFGFTIYQLRQATNQLQSSNEYEIRKDLRDIVQVVLDGEFDPKCLAASSECSPATTKSSKKAMGLVFNFHHSVYRQTLAAGVSRGFESQMAEDFCNWLKNKDVADFWTHQIESGAYVAERKEMRSKWCH